MESGGFLLLLEKAK